MDQRRVILFVVLSFLVLQLSGFLSPPPQPKKKPVAQQPAEQQPAQEDAALVPAEPMELEPRKDVALEYVTLGSVDPESAYRMLVTFTNRGAAVRRLELASERFRDLHDRGGYLGHLEVAADPAGGLRVDAVGAGTPAAAAGIARGDRLISIANTRETVTLEDAESLRAFLAKLRPGREATISFARGDQPPQSVTVTVSRRPLEVIRPEAENVLLRTKTLPADFTGPPSFLFTLEQAGNQKLSQMVQRAEKAAAEALAAGTGEQVAIPTEIDGVDLLDSNWEIVDRNESSVTFRQALPQLQLEVLKRYRLERVPADEIGNVDYPGYDFTLDLEVRNSAGESRNVAYQLDGPNGLPLEGWWFAGASKVGRTWSAVGIRDVMARFVGGNPVQFGPSAIVAGDVEPLAGQPLAFIGVDAQYFAAMILPDKAEIDEQWIDQCRTVLIGPKPLPRSSEERFANVSCRLTSQGAELKPGESLKHSFTVFAGPKRPGLLANYMASNDPYYSLSDLLYYGWFGGVAKAMLGILHFFYGIVHNYGLAIIMLTVLVRLCLFPLSRKQSQSMARMQELKPEMEKIKEKYKSDMQKQSQAMQELYRKYNINPMAGCLPMFIQLPILVGLYRSLMVDVELRDAPLFGENIAWCSNLAAPDMLWNWSGIMPNFVTFGFLGLGPYLNVLPLVTIALFLVQQKMFMPPAADEQAAMQQKIMKYMMVFMGFLFYKVASGLCIYFIASSLWGIAERKMLPSASLAAAGDSAGAATRRSPVEQNGQRVKRSGKAKKKR